MQIISVRVLPSIYSSICQLEAHVRGKGTVQKAKEKLQSFMIEMDIT